MSFDIMSFVVTILPTFIFIAVLFGLFKIFTEEDPMKKRCTVSVQATAINVVKKRPDNGTNQNQTSIELFYPEIEYTYNNNQYKCMSPIGENMPIYQIGQVITIMIDPDVPEYYYIVG